MLVLGNKYQFITDTLSSFQGTFDTVTGVVTFHLTLTNSLGEHVKSLFHYQFDDIPINYDTNLLYSSPAEVSNLAFGMFLIDQHGLVSFTKSNRIAVTKLVEANPGSVNLELLCNESVLEYRGKDLIINSPGRVIRHPSLNVLTRKYYNDHILGSQYLKQ